MWATLDILLNMDQFWIKFPNITCLYPEPLSRVISGQIEVNISDDVHLDIELPPTNLLNVDVSSSTLIPLTPNVIYIYMYIN